LVKECCSVTADLKYIEQIIDDSQRRTATNHRASSFNSELKGLC